MPFDASLQRCEPREGIESKEYQMELFSQFFIIHSWTTHVDRNKKQLIDFS